MVGVISIQDMVRLLDFAEAGYGIPFPHLGKVLVTGTMSINIPPCMLIGERDFVRCCTDDVAVLCVKGFGLVSKIASHHGDDERKAVGGPELRSRELSERVEEDVVDAQHSPILIVVSIRTVHI